MGLSLSNFWGKSWNSSQELVLKNFSPEIPQKFSNFGRHFLLLFSRIGYEKFLGLGYEKYLGMVTRNSSEWFMRNFSELVMIYYREIITRKSPPPGQTPATVRCSSQNPPWRILPGNSRENLQFLFTFSPDFPVKDSWIIPRLLGNFRRFSA